jgi:hypothetical protein
MKDYYKKSKGVTFVGIVTGKEFEQKYMEISNSEDKLPTASTIIPINSSDKEAEPIFHAWIYWETAPVPDEVIVQKQDKIVPLKLVM